MTIAEMRKRQAEFIATQRAMLDKVKTEKRGMNAQEMESYNSLTAQFDDMAKTIAAEERTAGIEAGMAKIPQGSTDGNPESGLLEFRNFLLTGRAPETRAGTIDTSGGSLAPSTWVQKLFQKAEAASRLYPIVNRMQVSAANVILPYVSTAFSDATWTTELPSAQASDSAGVIGGRTLTPLPLVKALDISDKALRMSAIPIEMIVQDILARKYAKAFDAAIATGSGSNQPLGMFVANAAGITTAQDVTTITASTLTPDDILNLISQMEGYYDPSSMCIVMHPTNWAHICMAKASSAGSYLMAEWQNAGTVRGVKIILSAYATATKADGDYVAVIGDMSQYSWIDATEMEVKKLDQPKATQLLTTYMGVAYAAGAPVTAGAFLRLKIKAT